MLLGPVDKHPQNYPLNGGAKKSASLPECLPPEPGSTGGSLLKPRPPVAKGRTRHRLALLAEF